MKIETGSVRAYLESIESHFGQTAFNTLLLERGRDFTPAPLPAEIKRQTIKLCFTNSAKLAKRKGLLYCEGLAISTNFLGLPIHHAWNATEDGTVIDSTWVPVGHDYFGIVVPMDEWDTHPFRTPLGVFA
jgi:hypothetical protein